MLPSIDDLNPLGSAAFCGALEPLFEGAPRFVALLSARRPYRSYDELLRLAQEAARNLPEDEQVELVNSHPRIGARPADVSPMSHREQGYDRGSASGDDEVQEALDRLNEAYERRFGFRFVVHVAGRPRAAIVPLIERSLGRERQEELRRALADVFAIARDRLQGLTGSEERA